MQPISSIIPEAARPSVSTAGVWETRAVQHPEAPSRERPQKPAMDEYIPEEKPGPSGRYWLDRDEDGTPKIRFDDPARAASQPEQPDGADSPEGKPAPGRKAADDKEVTCNTDKADREIKKLKEKQKELERQIQSETDEAKIRDLERKLAQVTSELRLKDNDTYRRQHAVFS